MYALLDLNEINAQDRDRFDTVCVCYMLLVKVLLTHWGQDKVDAILQTTHSNAFSRMKMFELRFKFHLSLFLRF